ncbi:hypothetical protein Glove_35g42 [Diversispora epigaea]|uniref:Uncharacterized protein n=1 Tax=Diversispora epigaea TaxID=1348612 RepID=A0A397JN75_9GLOM|nr:hypothetical protein Glove_35g42 [Diversispora epigaea]
MNEDYNENSDSDFSYSEYEDEFNEREIIEINEEIQDEEIQDELEVIPEVDTSHKTQTSCVIVDYIEGKIQTCNSTDKLRRLKNLFGSWQIDRDIVNAVDKDYLQLGVCYSHFLYDQNQLHNKNDKQKKSHKTTLIQRGRCIGCGKYFTFYNRGNGCINHSWVFNGRCLLVPCNGQFSCNALKEFSPLCYQISDEIKRPRYVCLECYQKNGGHIHERYGKGRKSLNCIQKELHKKDASCGLEVIAEWLLQISKEADEYTKNLILTSVINAIKEYVLSVPSENNNFYNFTSKTSTTSKQNKVENIEMSLFMIKMLFIDTFKYKKNKTNFQIQQEIDNPENLGKLFGLKLWHSRNEIKNRKSDLEFPDTIQKYYEAFPRFLISFLNGFITELEEKKNSICNRQRKHRGESSKSISTLKIIKIITFLASIFINIAFPSYNIWLPIVLTSLGQKPKLITSLHRFLNTCHVIAHTERHERNKEKERMSSIIPSIRLKKNKNIWNLAIIDNIDFKTKSFSFGNIYDVTRKTSHATLRMAFQWKLLSNIDSIPEIVQINEETQLFEMNLITQTALDTLEKIIEKLLNFQIVDDNFIYNQDFDTETIKKIIISEFEPGLILEPGNNPNSDDAILEAATMYRSDFELDDNDFLDIVGDEAFHRRLIKCIEKWPKLRPLLGAWHTFKDFCSALLVLFSSYGILNFARELGVRFLDKLEANVDYRSTSRVLDLIWTAVGISINIYIKKKEISLHSIMDGENIVLKV